MSWPHGPFRLRIGADARPPAIRQHQQNWKHAMSIAGRAHSSQTNGRLSGNEPPSERSATRGVILLNLGTPDAPHPREVRRYLAEFLSDPEVIRLPRRMRWMNPVLGGMIARIRAKQSAHAYSTIWTPGHAGVRCGQSSTAMPYGRL